MADRLMNILDAIRDPKLFGASSVCTNELGLEQPVASVVGEGVATEPLLFCGASGVGVPNASPGWRCAQWQIQGP